jgi:riboflavin biosynthesis pyrimidine reductase
MVDPFGPGRAFTLLFDEQTEPGPGLPESFRRVFAGDWRLLEPPGRPYVFVNFAVSRDGRVSFGEPGHMGGADVSGSNRHDQWLMGLLRARADAVLVGDNTLRIEAEHLWTAEYIFPTDHAAFAALRAAERRAMLPLQVFLSMDGDILPTAAVLRHPEMHIIIATTTNGMSRAGRLTSCPARVDVLELGREHVNIAALMSVLYTDYGVRTVLCEGGPRVYGSLLKAGRVDDEFLTLCPLVIGSASDQQPRPGLVEGVTFMPGAAPYGRPLSLRRVGDHMFLRSRYDASSVDDRRSWEG